MPNTDKNNDNDKTSTLSPTSPLDDNEGNFTGESSSTSTNRPESPISPRSENERAQSPELVTESGDTNEELLKLQSQQEGYELNSPDIPKAQTGGPVLKNGLSHDLSHDKVHQPQQIPKIKPPKQEQKDRKKTEGGTPPAPENGGSQLDEEGSTPSVQGPRYKEGTGGGPSNTRRRTACFGPTNRRSPN